MTVHFIGAGPGASDLITVRGLNLLRTAGVVLFAGSLIPRDLMTEARPDARIVDTAPLTLDEIVTEMSAAHDDGLDVARLHSGDPSLYGAIAEQMRRLDASGIPYTVTPGVPAYAAAAAALKTELTLPGIAQTVVLTRTSVRSSPMPEGEDLKRLGASRATLAIHLSVVNLARVVRDLTPLYGPDCPVIAAYRVSWPDELILRGRLSNIREKVKSAGLKRTVLILVGQVFETTQFDDSRLYAADHHHILRPERADRNSE